jgi:transposase
MHKAALQAHKPALPRRARPVIRSAGAHLLILARYSADLNPIRAAVHQAQAIYAGR